MKIAGATAEIRIEGILTKAPDIIAFLFGGGNTTYTEIIASLAVAQSDPSIRDIVLWIDSPGGTVDGFYEALAALEMARSRKTLSVKAANALSAAYGIAAAAGKIEAQSVGARFGSVGAAATYVVEDDVVEITNTDSPDKRPDVTTEEGKAVVRRELDAIYELFIDAIARGRGLTAEEVRETFGRGANLLAGDAKKRRMIDSISRPPLRTIGGAAAVQQAPNIETIGAQSAVDDQEKERTMDLRTLKLQHPDVYQAAFVEGETAERDRVGAHLTLGRTGGEEGLTIAYQAIESGAALNMTASARYTALALNARDRAVRQVDDRQTARAVDGSAQIAHVPGPAVAAVQSLSTSAPAGAPAVVPDLGDKVVEALRARHGKAAS
jgi:ClpP class serine protease